MADLPHARVSGIKEPSIYGDNILMVQAADVLKQHKLLPDITTWTQCYLVYASMMATQFPQVIPELLAYKWDIIRASKQFRWPSWVIYDTTFRRPSVPATGREWTRACMLVALLFGQKR